MSELMKTIDELMAKAWDELREAAHKKDSSALNPLNGRMAELNKMKRDLQAIIQRLEEMSTPNRAGATGGSGGLRKIRIRVTQGMINQNLLTLTEALRRGIVRTGEMFMIETFPNHRKFKTVLQRVGNKLQERGLIASFYRAANTQADGIVELVEIAPGSWYLKPAEGGDFSA
jgi:hypothetical protein